MVLYGRHWPACSCWESFMAPQSTPALGGWFSLWPCAPNQTCPMSWHNLPKTSPDLGGWIAFLPLLVPGCACQKPWCAGRQERSLLAPPGVHTKLSGFRGEKCLQTPVSHPDPSCMAGEEQPGTESSRDIVLSAEILFYPQFVLRTWATNPVTLEQVGCGQSAHSANVRCCFSRERCG